MTVTGIDYLSDRMMPARLLIPVSYEKSSIAQLFFDVGHGLREEDAASVEVARSGSWIDIAFPLPSGSVSALRFDPATQAGSFRIAAPRVESASGRIIHQFSLRDIIPQHQIASVISEGTGLTMTTTSDANDPQVGFKLEGVIASRSPALPWGRASVALLLIILGRLIWASSLSVRPHQPSSLIARGGSREDGACWLRWGLLVALLIIQLVRLWPLHRSIDLPLWDEANYMHSGRVFIESGGRLGDLHESPFYVLEYGLWWKMVGSVAAIYLQHYFLKSMVVVLMFLLLDRVFGSVVGAWVLALAWGSSGFVLEFPQLVYLYAFAWFLLGVLLWDRSVPVALSCFALCVLSRQEYQFVLLGMWLVLLISTLRGRVRVSSLLNWRGSSLFTKTLFVLLSCLLVFLATRIGWRHAGDRAWFAFQQHYALRATEIGAVSNLNPWLDYGEVVRKDFGPSNSLLTAFRHNPTAFLRHLGYNLSRAFGETFRLLEPVSTNRISTWVLWALGVVAMVLCRSRSNFPAGSAYGWIGVFSFVTVLPGLMIYAKSAYLLPILLLLVLVAGFIIRRMRARYAWIKSGSHVAGMVGMVAVSLCFNEREVFETQARPVAETVEELSSIWPKDRESVLLGLSASSLSYYIDSGKCMGVEPLRAIGGGEDRALSLQDLMNRWNPYAVLVTEEWKSAKAFDQPEFNAVVLKNYPRSVQVPLGELFLKSEDLY